jgi:threonine/homoserine/homoserine lactone efflux protein
MLTLMGLSSTSELLLFMAAVLVLNATPGVDMLLTVTRTLQGGARAGLSAAAGISAGCVVHALAAAFGLAALLAVSPTAFAAVKWAGAAYLVWLAWGMLRLAWQGRPTASIARGSAPRSAWVDFRSGALTNVLNPKVALFFLAFLPQFIAPATPHKSLALLLLSALLIAQSAVFLAALVAMATRARGLQLGAGAQRLLDAAGGTLFAALAVRLALARPGHT